MRIRSRNSSSISRFVDIFRSKQFTFSFLLFDSSALLMFLFIWKAYLLHKYYIRLKKIKRRYIHCYVGLNYNNYENKMQYNEIINYSKRYYRRALQIYFPLL